MRAWLNVDWGSVLRFCSDHFVPLGTFLVRYLYISCHPGNPYWADVRYFFAHHQVCELPPPPLDDNHRHQLESEQILFCLYKQYSIIYKIDVPRQAPEKPIIIITNKVRHLCFGSIFHCKFALYWWNKYDICEGLDISLHHHQNK
jgi:hypothetical protein